MSEFVTAKDELANLIETGLIDMGVDGDTTEMSILLVQKMETAGLLPTEREYSLGSEHTEFVFGEQPQRETFEEPPPVGEGEYLLQRLCTPWMGQAL